MSRGQQYAAVASRLDTLGPLKPVATPQAATVAAVIDGTTYVSTVLPWTSASGKDWPGSNFTERTVRCLGDLRPFLVAQPELVWGGDWNHTLQGSLQGQTRAGRDVLQDMLGELGLVVPTCSQTHGTVSTFSIDHIAVHGPVLNVEHHRASLAAKRLSDHDLYVVTV